jgi:GNAT superfamily N-acetyltransferase
MTAPVIRALDATEAAARLSFLADILTDAVAHGASVNFMAGLSQDTARAFWEGQLPGLAEGATRLLIAEDRARLVGTILLFLARQPNAPHRAEIGKLLVLSSMRGQGVGGRLLTAAEDLALRIGRTLLLLDTQSGSAADGLYRRRAWTPAGEIPGHAFTPDGVPAGTTLFYKVLGPHRHPSYAA